MLVLIAPQGMTDKERYAVDQYLMRGGSVVVAAGNFRANQDQMTGGLALEPVENGLADCSLTTASRSRSRSVMDPQNEPFPVPVQRKVGGIPSTRSRRSTIPFFVDVRAEGMDKTSPIVSTCPR